MPAGLLQLVIFIALLAPGIFYFAVFNAFKPERELSALRETAVVSLMGVLCDVLALSILLVVRLVWEFPAPDVHGLFTEPIAYVAANPGLVWSFSVAFLVIACLIATGLAVWFVRVRAIGTISNYSAWYQLMHVPADHVVYCGCQLDDDSWIGGYLLSYNTDAKETGDRELVLRPPITYRGTAAQDAAELPNVSAISVSAGRIRFLQVSYLSPEILEDLR